MKGRPTGFRARRRPLRATGWWVPDALSIGRLLSLPLVLWLLGRVGETAGGVVDADRALAVAALALVAATDWLDGYLARRLHAVSTVGSTVDAVADKAVQFVPLFWFALAASPAFPHVPLWIPSVLLGLELLLSAAWLGLHATMGRPLPTTHNAAGRLAGWTLFGLLLWIAADLPAAAVAPIGAAALVFSTWSAVGYLRDWLDDVAASTGSGTSAPE